MSLLLGETHLYVVAMGGGGGESFQGKINGIDLTSLPAPQVQVALNSENGYLDISRSLEGFNPVTVENGSFSVVLAQVQSALQGQLFGKPPSPLTAALTGITPSAWPFPSGNAVVFRFEASALNLIPVPGGLPGPVPGNQSVTLSWLAPSYPGASPISDYSIQYSTDGESWNLFNDGVSVETTAMVTGLANGTKYRFRVAAINSYGVGIYSLPSQLVQPSGPLPFAPIFITGAEDQTLTFLPSSFLSAVANGSGPALYGVRIKSLPNSGVLRRSGAAVAVGDLILTSEIGTLTYTPAPNESGSKTFKVDASDGVFFSSESEVRLDLAPENDPPAFGGFTKLYETVTPSRGANGAIIYTSGFGTGATDAAAVFAAYGKAIDRIRYRMELIVPRPASVAGTLRYAEATFDAWTGVTASNLQIPDNKVPFIHQRDVSNLSVASDYPGAINGTGLLGRLEIWPYSYVGDPNTELSGGDGAFDFNDTATPGEDGHGTFQVHNLTDSQTVLSWNRHFSGQQPEIGFGKNPEGQPDWTFSTLGSTGWKLQISAGTTGSAVSPSRFEVTEDLPGNLRFSENPFVDVDGDPLTVTLSVPDGSLVASASTDIAVTGDGLIRTFVGSVSALNQYFSTAGNITYQGPANANGERTLTVTVSDGTASIISTSVIAIAPVNDAPALTLPVAAVASGGERVELDGYVVHTFREGGTFLPEFSGSVEVLVVGGGGGGGVGGGGAGGVVYQGSYSVSAFQALSVTVGNGGAGGVKNGTVQDGSNGGDTIFGSITAFGGGGGGGHTHPGLSGASSGGAGSDTGAVEGAATQGNPGAKGAANEGYVAGGGGGGAGTPGTRGLYRADDYGNGSSPGGNGGDGVSYSISGTTRIYGGGGGGGANNNMDSPTALGGVGGQGGGGAGARSNLGQGAPGEANSGGGGGGGDPEGLGGAGGSGIVIVRYPSRTLRLKASVSAESFANLTGTVLSTDVENPRGVTLGVQGGMASSEPGKPVAAGNYGTLQFDTASGSFTYLPNPSVIRGLERSVVETFTITASDGSAQSTLLMEIPIEVTPATQLAITKQPAKPSSNGTLSTQPVVEIRDAQGNRVSSTAWVTALIDPGSPGTLSGTLRVRAVGGVATFTDLSISGLPAGERPRLRFTGGQAAASTAGRVGWSYAVPNGISAGVSRLLIDQREFAEAGLSPTEVDWIQLLGVYTGPATYLQGDASWAQFSIPSALSGVAASESILVNQYGELIFMAEFTFANRFAAVTSEAMVMNRAPTLANGFGSGNRSLSTDFSTLPNNVTLGGKARIENGEAILTDPINSQVGFLTVDPFSQSPDSFMAEFSYRAFDGSGADGTSFNYGQLSDSYDYANVEYGRTATGLVVSLIEWEGERVEASVNGVTLFKVPFWLTSNDYRKVRVVVDGVGFLSVSIDGQVVNLPVDLGSSYRSANKTGWRFGFGSRTGAANNRHSLDNLYIGGDIPETFALIEDTQGNLAFYGTPFADPDGDVLTVTLSVDDGSVTGADGDGITVGGTPLARTFSGSVSALNAYFTTPGKVTYLAPSNGSGSKTLTVRASDGFLESSRTAILSVAAVNDLPVVSASQAVTTATEQVSVAVDPAITVSDVDNTTLASATVSVSGGFRTGEDVLGYLSAATYGNISGSYAAATGVLTLTSSGSSATLAQWQAALRSITYLNASDAPNTADRTITWVVNDGAGTSLPVTKTVSVKAVNDAPALTTPGAIALGDTSVSDAFQTQTGKLVGTDVDSVNFVYGITGGSGDQTTMSKTGKYGTLKVTIATGDYWLVPNASAINGLNADASETFEVTVADGQATATANLVVNLKGVNDAPVMTAITKSGVEDTTFSFVLSDFTSAYSDAEGDTQSRIRIESLPATGTLKSNGEAVSLGQEIPLAALQSGPADGRIGYWSFDSSSSLEKNAVTGDSLNNSGGATYLAEGKVGGALSLNGAQWLNSPSGTITGLPTGNSSYTIALWFKADDFAARGFVGWGNYNNVRKVNAFRLNGTTQLINYWWAQDLVGTVSDASVGFSQMSTGTWYHAAATWDGTTRRMYLNGKLIASDAPGTASVEALNFGIGKTVSNEYFKGALDELYIYSRALTSAEISTLVGVSGSMQGGLTYEPAANEDGSKSFTISASDGTAWSAPALVTVDLAAVNDAPVAVPSQGSTVATEQVPVAVDSGITVSDPENATLVSATVTVSAGYRLGEDVLGYQSDLQTRGNIAGSFNGSTGVLSLTSAGATATMGQWQEALRAVTYLNTSDTPNTSDRTMTWSVNDGALVNPTVTKTLTVKASNDAPFLAVVNPLSGGVEDTDYTITYAALAAAADESDVDSATVSFRIEGVTSGALTLNGTAVVPGSTLLAAGESLSWRPALNANGLLGAFTVRAWDGQAASATALPVTVSVAAVADEVSVEGFTAVSKVYDGTRVASVSGTPRLVGLPSGVDVQIQGTPVFTLAQATVGTAVAIQVSGLTLVGAQAADYTMVPPQLVASITPKPISIEGLTGVTKVYDGTTAATVSGTAVLSGVVSGDEGQVTLSGTPVFTLASAHVGTGIAISTSGYTLSGSRAGNYSLSPPTMSATITTDGLVGSQLIAFSQSSLSIPVNQQVTINQSSQLPSGAIVERVVFSFEYATYWSPSWSAVAGNYVKLNGVDLPELGWTSVGTGNAWNAETRTYLGTLPAFNRSGANVWLIGSAWNPVSLRNATMTLYYWLPGKLSQTLAFDPLADVTYGVQDIPLTASASSGLSVDWEVASGPGQLVGSSLKVLGAGSIVVRATQAGDSVWYAAPPVERTLVVGKKALSVTSPTVVTKVYEGTASATISGTLSGVLTGDGVTLVGTGVFAGKNAAVDQGVTSTSTLSGAAAGNYTLTQPTGLKGTITPKALSIGAPTIASKVYDGTTTAGVVTVGALSGLVGSETLTVTGTAAPYGSAAVGTYPSVVVTYTLANGGSGNTAGLAANYSLAAGTASGTITPEDLVIAVDPASLVQDFDGNPRTVVWTTTPAGIPVSVLYNGSTSPPKIAGSYPVTLTSADPNYSARLTVTLVIRKTLQGITLNAAVVAAGLQTVADASGRFLLQATLGQPIAGTTIGATGMRLDSGFWFTEQFSAALEGRTLVGLKSESKIRGAALLRTPGIEMSEAGATGPEIDQPVTGIQPLPRLVVMPMTGSGEVWIRISGVPADRWLIQYQDRLHSDQWFDESPVELDADGAGAVRASTGVGEMRFYRLVQP